MTDAAADRQAIADRLAEYAWTFDSHDVDGWVALFTEDGIFESRLEGRDAPLFRLQGTAELPEFATTAPVFPVETNACVFPSLCRESPTAIEEDLRRIASVGDSDIEISSSAWMSVIGSDLPSRIATNPPTISCSSNFLRRMISLVFIRVNSKCAHQVRPPSG